MKKLRRREVLLMVLPVIALVGLPFVLAKGAPSQGFKAQIVPLPPTQGKNWRGQLLPYAPDTQLNITVTYVPPSVKKRLSPPSFQTWGTQLIDEEGRQYKFLITKDIRPGRQLWHQEWIFSYPLSLSRIPKSAGKVTFKTNISFDNGQPIPVSVVVRDKT